MTREQKMAAILNFNLTKKKHKSLSENWEPERVWVLSTDDFEYLRFELESMQQYIKGLESHVERWNKEFKEELGDAGWEMKSSEHSYCREGLKPFITKAKSAEDEPVLLKFRSELKKAMQSCDGILETWHEKGWELDDVFQCVKSFYESTTNIMSFNEVHDAIIGYNINHDAEKDFDFAFFAGWKAANSMHKAK